MNGVFYPSPQKKSARSKNHKVHLLQRVRLDPKPIQTNRQENNPGIHRDLQRHAGNGERGTRQSEERGREGDKKTSVEITCDVEGVEEFKAAMDRFNSAMQRQVYRYLHSWASEVKAAAMRNAPVRTGHLRGSIYARIRDWVAEIGAEATYALFVEFGTRRMHAQPFLYPAIQTNLPRLEAIILDALEAAKAEAGLE